MNLYRIIQNAILSRRTKEGVMMEEHLDKPVVQLKREEVSFSSSEIVPITTDGVLDTDDSLTVAKYKNNIRLLVERAKQTGKIDKFLLIREDDMFPYDWKWRKNSSDTMREYARSSVCYAVRMAKAHERIKERKHMKDNPLGFEIPIDPHEISEEIENLPENYGMIYEPVHFRSTKHFTMNLPLPYTGTYNQVSSGRNFIVIDTPDAFCKSGFGYSADYGDCYLDVTHESLPISLDAIVLIHEDKYSEIMKNPEIREQLQDRRVVVYRGNEGMAINMVLSQEGVLPFQENAKIMEYDDSLHAIMDQSMQDFCREHHLDYKHNHGNLFGKGGHFTDFFDGENRERKQFEQEFVSFLRSVLPEYSGLINDTFFQVPDKIVRAIGPDKIASAIEQYNLWAKEEEVRKRRTYDLERDKITPDVHMLFVQTLQLIRDYYDMHDTYDSSVEVHEAVRSFFHSSSVDEQMEAAHKLQSLIGDKTKQY